MATFEVGRKSSRVSFGQNTVVNSDEPSPQQQEMYGGGVRFSAESPGLGTPQQARASPNTTPYYRRQSSEDSSGSKSFGSLGLNTPADTGFGIRQRKATPAPKSFKITSAQEPIEPVATQKSIFSSRPPPKASRSLASRTRETDSSVRAAETIDSTLFSPPSQKAFSEGWVLVIGDTDRSKSQAILQMFQRFGNVVEHLGVDSLNSPRQNWIALQYESDLQAHKALCQDGTVLRQADSSVIVVAVRALTPELSRQLGLSENITPNLTSLATTPATPVPFWSPMPKRRPSESPELTEDEDDHQHQPVESFRPSVKNLSEDDLFVPTPQPKGKNRRVVQQRVAEHRGIISRIVLAILSWFFQW